MNGLNNFIIGFPTVVPTEGSVVDSGSYDACGSVLIGVDIGIQINVVCSPATTARYVIIQSLDTSAERLCIAEACVIAASEYAVGVVSGLEKTRFLKRFL